MARDLVIGNLGNYSFTLGGIHSTAGDHIGRGWNSPPSSSPGTGDRGGHSMITRARELDRDPRLQPRDPALASGRSRSRSRNAVEQDGCESLGQVVLSLAMMGGTEQQSAGNHIQE